MAAPIDFSTLRDFWDKDSTVNMTDEEYLAMIDTIDDAVEKGNVFNPVALSTLKHRALVEYEWKAIVRFMVRTDGPLTDAEYFPTHDEETIVRYLKAYITITAGSLRGGSGRQARGLD